MKTCMPSLNAPAQNTLLYVFGGLWLTESPVWSTSDSKRLYTGSLGSKCYQFIQNHIFWACVSSIKSTDQKQMYFFLNPKLRKNITLRKWCERNFSPWNQTRNSQSCRNLGFRPCRSHSHRASFGMRHPWRHGCRLISVFSPVSLRYSALHCETQVGKKFSWFSPLSPWFTWQVNSEWKKTKRVNSCTKWLPIHSIAIYNLIII